MGGSLTSADGEAEPADEATSGGRLPSGLQSSCGIALDDLVSRFRSASDARDLERLAPGFLILGSALERPSGPLLTVSVPTAHEAPTTTALRVYPVARRAGSAYGWISVGRARNNDISLDDVSVSKFHAYFRQEDGVLYLLDARSRNGTFVDGQPVPARGRGLAVQVASGASVRFGNSHTSFVNATDLHRMLGHFSS